MDTSNDTNEPTPDAVEPTASDTPSIARLVRTADRLLRVAAGDALRAEDVHPRQLRALRAVASGHVSPRGGRALRALVRRGWVQVGADGTALTADGQDALDRLSGVARDARDAVAASLADYAEKAKNLGHGIGHAVVSAFQSAENMIGDFVKTGKASIRDFVTSVLADFAKIAARHFILGPLAGALTELDDDKLAELVALSTQAVAE